MRLDVALAVCVSLRSGAEAMHLSGKSAPLWKEANDVIADALRQAYRNPVEGDLTVAPGADDFTFGATLNWMINQCFDKTLNFSASFCACKLCRGDDRGRPFGTPSTFESVKHADGCFVAKHLPRLRAMENKGVER